MDCEEIWKEVKDFEDYEISNTAKIRNKLNGNILKQQQIKY